MLAWSTGDPTPVPVAVTTKSAAPARGCNCSTCRYWIGDPETGAPGGDLPLCSGRNTSCAYCGCDAGNPAEPVEDTACGTCPVRCGSRSDIDAWMDAVGGTLGLSDITYTSRPYPADLIGRVVPLSNGRRIHDIHETVRWPAWGTTLQRVLSRALHSPQPNRTRTSTRLVMPRWEQTGAHHNLDLRDGQRAVLAGYGPDPVVEAFWTHRTELIERISNMGWDLVTSPDYSVFTDMPRAEQLLNMRRSLLVAAALNAAGVTCAPSIYGFRREDLDHWLEWIDANQPTAIALNTHTQHHPREWEQLQVYLSYFADHLAHLDADPVVVITGVNNYQRLSWLRDTFDRLTLLTQQPFQLAAHGRLATVTGRTRFNADLADLTIANLDHTQSILSGHI